MSFRGRLSRAEAAAAAARCPHCGKRLDGSAEPEPEPDLTVLTDEELHQYARLVRKTLGLPNPDSRAD